MTSSAVPLQDRSRARRDAILRAAIDLLADGGARAVTHRAVAQRADVPLAATTYYFASIGQLTQEALRLHVTERVDQLRAITEAATETEATATEIAERFVEALMSRDPAATIAQFEVYLEAARNPELREVVGTALDAFEKLGEVTLAGLGAREPAQAANGFVAIINGFALNRLARPRSVEADARSMLDGIRALFIYQLLDDPELARWNERLNKPAPQ